MNGSPTKGGMARRIRVADAEGKSHRGRKTTLWFSRDLPKPIESMIEILNQHLERPPPR